MGKMRELKSVLGNALSSGIVDISNKFDSTEIVKQQSNFNTKQLAAREGRLKQETIIAVDPKKCKLWNYHNRQQQYLTPETCADVIESLKQNGQDTPALARELFNDPDYDFELIYGSRRKFSCEYLGKLLLVKLTTDNDQECVARMDIENRARKDISDYERALDYKTWLDKGLYRTVTSLAEKIGVNKGWTSKILRLADLPETIVQAFSSPLDIKIHYGVELLKLVEDSSHKEKVFRKARELKDKKLDGNRVYKTLLSSIQKTPQRKPENTVLQIKGKKIGIIGKSRTGSFQIKINSNIKKEDVDMLKNEIGAAILRFF